ncbi:MAG: beta strand repeat-containing protein, partial [Planctomyces sp.]
AFTAGSTAGSVTLTNSDLSAARVDLTALSGSVLHGPDGLIDTVQLHMLSSAGVSALTRAEDVEAVVSVAGDIQIRNLRGMRLLADTANGAIEVSAAGSINAERVVALGTSQHNGISVSALSASEGSLSDIWLGTLTSSDTGNITLVATGRIDGLANVVVDAQGLQARSLKIMAQEVPNLVLRASEADITVLGPGDLSITELGVGALTLSASLRNGALTVNHALGDLTLRDVSLNTDAEQNDLTVIAGGTIRVGRISLGQFYADAADIPELANGAAPGIYSLGDVYLTAGGAVLQDPADDAIDLIADDLVIHAETGVGLLQTSVQTLEVTTTLGSIDIADTDSAGETTPGLRRLIAEAPAGSVTVSTGGSVNVDSVIATGEFGVASVFSSDGNLRVAPGISGDRIQFTLGIDLRAGKTLRLPTFWTASDLISYRADELIFDDVTQDGNGGTTDGHTIPASLAAARIVLEQRNGLVLSQTTSIETQQLELYSHGNISVTGMDLLKATTLIVHARGLHDVTARRYNPETNQLEDVTEETGNISIEATQIGVEQWEIRGRRRIFLEFSGAAEDSMTVTGVIGGMTDGVRAESLTFRSPLRKLRLDDAVLEADTAALKALAVRSDRQTEIRASEITAESGGDLRLCTATGLISAVSTGPGNIYIQNVGTVTLENVVAQNGAITIRGDGDITALNVVQRTDGVNKDIRLTAGGSIYVDYIDAGQLGGAVRTASRVILRAAGTIEEPADRIDNQVPDDPTQQAGSNIVDVVAWKMTFYHDQPMPEPTLIQSERDIGTSAELEIVYISDTAGVLDDEIPNDQLPSAVTGNYTLSNVDYYDDINMKITGNLIINAAPTAGQSMTFEVGGSIIINTALDAGGGVVSLVTTGAVTITAPITAEEITISAGSLTQPLVTDTDRLTLSLGTAGQNIVVQEADQLVLGSSTINGGSLTLTAGGAVTVDGTISNVSSLNLNSSGSIRGMVGAELEVSGAAHLTGSSITLGTQPGETINFGSLQVTSTGAVSITEDSSISLRGANTAGSLTLRTTTTVADAGSSIAVTGDLQVEASSITLADSGQESLNVSGNALFTTSTGGNIVVAAAGNAQFGSVTFQTDNSVSIAEDGDMQLSGSSSAQSVTLNSSGAITDSGATLIVTGDVQLTGNVIALTNTVNEQINVSGNVSFTSTGADITIGATGTTNFGSMTFTTTGSVSIAEDSSSNLVGNSTGGSLTSVSSGTITDTTGGAASIVLTGDASLTGANIVLGDNSGDNISVAGNAVLSAT